MRPTAALTAVLLVLLTACGGDSAGLGQEPSQTAASEVAGAIEVPAASPCAFVDMATVEALLGDAVTFEEVDEPGQSEAPPSGGETAAPSWSCFYQGEQYSYDDDGVQAYAASRLSVGVGGAFDRAEWDRTASLRSQLGDCTTFTVGDLGEITAGADCVRSGAIRSIDIAALYPQTAYGCTVEREAAGAPEDLQQQLIDFCVEIARAAADA